MYRRAVFHLAKRKTTASTNLNEQGWNSDLIELSLAHVEGNSVRAAYNRAERLPERREMMQAWADWLDGLRGFSSGAEAVPCASEKQESF